VSPDFALVNARGDCTTEAGEPLGQPQPRARAKGVTELTKEVNAEWRCEMNENGHFEGERDAHGTLVTGLNRGIGGESGPGGDGRSPAPGPSGSNVQVLSACAFLISAVFSADSKGLRDSVILWA
jgi:hypothetical protein